MSVTNVIDTVPTYLYSHVIWRKILAVCPTTLFIILFVLATEGQCFSRRRVDHLKNLALFDVELARFLEGSLLAVTPVTTINDADLTHDRLNRVRSFANRYVEDFKDGNGVQTVEQVEVSDIDTIIGHPVSMYRLIRRGHLLMNETAWEAKTVYGGYVLVPEDDLIPKQRDQMQAIKAILNMHYSTLYFNVTRFADGNAVPGRLMTMNPKLRGVHCEEFGRAALEYKMLAEAVEWFAEARRRAAEDRTVSLELVEQRLAQAVELHDAAWFNAFNSTTASSRETQVPQELGLFVNPLRSTRLEGNNLKMIEQLYEKTKGKDVLDIVINSMGLCNGQNLQSPAVKSHLFCWHEFKIHPIFSIGPLKMEFLDRHPDIVHVHNAFFPADVREMRESAPWGAPEWAGFHTLETLQAKLRSRITQKTGAMLALNSTGSWHTRMQWKRASTVVGGGSINHLHVDGFGAHRMGGVEPEWRYAFAGEKFVTVLMYLNTVDEGGRTAFPISLTSVKPTSGSAIFYFNFLSDGLTQDPAMFHLGCPVLQGQKWFAVDLIRMYDQFLTKPCLLSPTERFQVPVNGQLLPLADVLRRKLGEREGMALQQMHA